MDGTSAGEGYEYLVKWLGWGDEHNSWEPQAHLENAQHLVALHHDPAAQDGDTSAGKKAKKAALKRTSSKVQQLVYGCGKLLCSQKGKGLKEDQKGEAFLVWLCRPQQSDISQDLIK